MAYTTINKPSEYFNTVLYQSNNGTPQSITGVGFQPDFLWVKDRNGGGTHVLVDAVRGSTKWLASDQTSGEVTRADQVTSFDSDGFSLGADSGNFINYSTDNNVAWNWLANGSGSSNTDGSITSTVSANTTSGFSIVSYTGNGSSTGSNVVGHGLGTTPSMIIIKARAGTTSDNNWYCWHKGLSANNNISLNTTSAQFTTSTASSGIINTSPTATTFGFDSGTSLININQSGTTYIAYCFAEKKGYSKFGSYVGNGNADGTFVYTGFKPKFTIIKRIDTADDWTIWDSARNSYNGVNWTLEANGSGAEWNDANFSHDYLSNGFKLRNSFIQTNVNGGTFIYMAFAENPLVGTNGVPATAR